MENTSTMLCVAPERPLPPMGLEALRLIATIAGDMSLDYFLTGAMARDILLRGVFGIEIGRATLDVDVAISLDTWPEFDAVKSRFLETGTVRGDPNMPHRLWHRAYPLDLLPFGGIEIGQHQIAWPPDLSILMSVAGYREAQASAQKVEIHPGLVVPVTSLPALAFLKLFAWSDRGAANPKDALDLAILLRSYDKAGNEDRLYGGEIEILEAADYNLELAGPRLLGRDARRILTPDTYRRVVALLEDRRCLDLLVSDLARGLRGTEDPVAVAESLIDQFTIGLKGA